MSYDALFDLINTHEKIVFFGGAGTSTASGIPDFRSQQGLYASDFQGLSPEVILSRSFFMAQPDLFYRFLREKLYYPNAEPNDCHKALAHLEAIGKLRALITQNIDGLHQRAGSTCVIELHGNMDTLKCMRCDRTEPLRNHTNGQGVPICPVCQGLLKPEVTLYEETLDETVVEGAIEALSSAEVLIVGGTSLSVYPAAGFVRYFKGQHLVLLNASVTPYDDLATLIIRDPIDQVLGEVVLNRLGEMEG